ncbi:MAG: flagellar export chaperone FliS [Deltaproteobacteria bacterium]|nr:flagellar export chaperone FliS [Deltaproteobacteria bacterium]
MNRVAQYQNIQVMTADKVRIIIMMYDGVLRFNRCAQKAIADKDIASRTLYLNKSLAIISELANSLNMEEGGEIARNLARLYDFAQSHLTNANMTNDGRAIEAVNRVMGELKAGWEAIAGQEKASAEPRREGAGVSCGV